MARLLVLKVAAAGDGAAKLMKPSHVAAPHRRKAATIRAWDRDREAGLLCISYLQGYADGSSCRAPMNRRRSEEEHRLPWQCANSRLFCIEWPSGQRWFRNRTS